jgi:hypothetical protein
MKLSEYAKQRGIPYKKAWKAFKEGSVSGYQKPDGSIEVNPKLPCVPFKGFKRSRIPFKSDDNCY